MDAEIAEPKDVSVITNEALPRDRWRQCDDEEREPGPARVQARMSTNSTDSRESIAIGSVKSIESGVRGRGSGFKPTASLRFPRCGDADDESLQVGLHGRYCRCMMRPCDRVKEVLVAGPI